MESISLKEFALSGKFGPVSIGMKKEQVMELLGKPSNDNSYSTGYSSLIYGYYELFIEPKTNILDSIQNDHLQADTHNHAEKILFKNDCIEIDTWFLRLNEDITRKEVKEILNEQNIPFKEEEYWNQTIIRFESGVYLDFDDRDGFWTVDDEGNAEVVEEFKIEDKELFVLNGIRHFPKM